MCDRSRTSWRRGDSLPWGGASPTSARPDVRAARRAKEVRDLDYATVAADLARRDALDQGRTHDPLMVADDAVVIDTSDMTIDEIVADLVQRL